MQGFGSHPAPRVRPTLGCMDDTLRIAPSRHAARLTLLAPVEVMGDDITQAQAFARANDAPKNVVRGISDITHVPGLVNVAFEGLKS